MRALILSTVFLWSGLVCLMAAPVPDAELAGLVQRLSSSSSESCCNVLRMSLLKPLSVGRNDAAFSAKLAQLARDDNYSLALTRYRLLTECEPAALDTFCHDPQNRDLLEMLLGDREWMEALLCSGGLHGRGHKVLEVLGELNEGEPEALKHPHYRKLASAIALGFGVSKRGENLRQERNVTPLGRLRYFMEAHRAGRLHRMFDTLETWELFYLVVVTADDVSMPWLLDNINIPLERYTDACWMCEYRAGTVFGGWVHANGFYAPWEKAMGNAENTYRHGGVCGALSHYGAMAAAAHGIPAIPMGQPGHCAYGVRVARNDWRGGFGGPYGGSYTTLFDHYDEHTDFLFLGETVLGQWDRNVLSRRIAWIAALLGSQRHEYALSGYQLAIKAQPENVMTWGDALNFVATSPSAKAQEFEIMAHSLGKALGADHPYVAISLIRSLEKPYLNVLKSTIADEDARQVARVKLWSSIYETAAGSGWYGWQNIHAWSDGLKRLGKNKNARKQFVDQLVHSSRNSASALAAVLGWSQDAMSDPEEQAQLIAAINRSMGDGQQQGDATAQRDFYNKLVLMTENAASLDAFQSVSRKGESLWNDTDRQRTQKKVPEGMPKPSGKLLSVGGLLRLSSTSSWDCPLLHARVLDERLGFFHTAGEVNPWVQVMLPKLGEPSGMLIIPEGGDAGRLLPLKVLVSEDGQDWTTLWETDSMAPYWVVPINQRLRVRYIKVERTGSGGDVFHLRGILVYGRDLQ